MFGLVSMMAHHNTLSCREIAWMFRFPREERVDRFHCTSAFHKTIVIEQEHAAGAHVWVEEGTTIQNGLVDVNIHMYKCE